MVQVKSNQTGEEMNRFQYYDTLFYGGMSFIEKDSAHMLLGNVVWRVPDTTMFDEMLVDSLCADT
eukprot:m.23728 g.23728  ORF g.23728 m.23728 type:complete len:65 (+) comp12975_c0_seq2:62-256(+)